MIGYLNEDEIYRVGIAIEETGLDFYTKMAEKADDAATKRIFRRLARDEKRHLAFFETLELKTTGGMGKQTAEQDADTSAYVSSLVDGGIFRNIARMAKLAKRKYNPEAALELALAVEKDTVLYYTEAYRVNRNAGAKKALQRLIDEEKTHVVQITERLDKVLKRKENARKK